MLILQQQRLMNSLAVGDLVCVTYLHVVVIQLNFATLTVCGVIPISTQRRLNQIIQCKYVFSLFVTFTRQYADAHYAWKLSQIISTFCVIPPNNTPPFAASQGNDQALRSFSRFLFKLKMTVLLTVLGSVNKNYLEILRSFSNSLVLRHVTNSIFIKK